MFNISGRIKIWRENQRIDSLRRQSNLRGALDAACRVRDLTARIYGLNHLNYALSINNLVSILFQLGNYAEAEPLFFQAIEIIRKANKLKHPLYSALLNNFGETKRMMGKYQEAINIHEEALEIRKKAGSRAEYAQSLYNLANAYIATKNTGKAKILLKIALDLRMQSLGKNHPDTVKTLNRLADM